MFAKEKIFTVYEKPESAEPTDRVVLVREGFSFAAFAFSVFWLIANRMWRVLALYLVAVIMLAMLCEILNASDSFIFALMWLELMLAYHAYDLQGWALRRKDYRVAGVLAAESEMHAQRRYYEFAA